MPNRTKFTQAAVDNLRPPASGRETYWDSQFPGFGLRVSAPRPGSRDGRKTWIAMGRVDGRAVMVTIGTLAQIPKVGKAREMGRAAILKMKAGTKPLDERRAERERKQAEEVAAEAAVREAVEGRFDAAAERFLAEHIERKCSPKYAAEVRRILEHDVLPVWGERATRSITKHDVNELLDAKARSRLRKRKGTGGGAAIQANRTLTRLRTLFAWAAAQDLIDADPSAGVLPRGKERARDRVLSDDEMVLFWRGAERAGWPFGAVFRLLLLTAQREGEIAGMRWSEIDLEKRVWTIPRERTKSDRGHVVHLSEFACGILATVPRVGDLLFSTSGQRPVSGFSKAKDRLDAVMTALLREATGDPEAAISPWIIHDLRRCATTIMARLNVAPHVADKVLNHSGGTIRGVAATYNRFAYLDERKAAMEALGRFVEALVRPGDAGNVVEINRARA
jgi:integrase